MVINYHYSLRNNPEERSSQTFHDGSLKSNIFFSCNDNYFWCLSYVCGSVKLSLQKLTVVGHNFLLNCKLGTAVRSNNEIKACHLDESYSIKFRRNPVVRHPLRRTDWQPCYLSLFYTFLANNSKKQTETPNFNLGTKRIQRTANGQSFDTVIPWSTALLWIRPLKHMIPTQSQAFHST